MVEAQHCRIVTFDKALLGSSKVVISFYNVQLSAVNAHKQNTVRKNGVKAAQYRAIKDHIELIIGLIEARQGKKTG